MATLSGDRVKSEKQKRLTIGIVLDQIRRLRPDERRLLFESLGRTMAAELAEKAREKAEGADAA
jgi:hypothetical protein